jgi:hypothetical protein
MSRCILRDAARVQISAKPQKAYGMVRRVALAVLLLLCFTSPCFARHHVRKVHKPVSALFPTAGSMLRQNAEADRLHLARIKNKAMLRELISDGELIPLPESSSIISSVPPWRAYLRSWAASELLSVAQDYYSVTGRPIRVDSAVRPLDVQKRLLRWNRAAAPVKGPTASVHPAGIAFDLQRNGLTRAQQQWLEFHLWYLQALGRVIVEEERNCFHIVAVLSDTQLDTSMSLEITIPEVSSRLSVPSLPELPVTRPGR